MTVVLMEPVRDEWGGSGEFTLADRSVVLLTASAPATGKVSTLKEPVHGRTQMMATRHAGVQAISGGTTAL